MNDKPQNLRESLWRRQLTDAERAELRARPETAADLELESRLSEMLAKIPDAPVASNFTARLMQAVAREESRPSRRWSFRWNWHVLLPRIAVTAAVVLFAGVTFHHYELVSQRTALAKNVALVAGSQPLPSVDVLDNFDAIQRLSQPAHADEELLALLQ
jgi:negative regulator of sigma E activity